MMKILFACIFIYIHVYVKMVLLLVFSNSRKPSSSKAEREEKQRVINRPDGEMWPWLPKLRATLSQCCLYLPACFFPWQPNTERRVNTRKLCVGLFCVVHHVAGRMKDVWRALWCWRKSLSSTVWPWKHPSASVSPAEWFCMSLLWSRIPSVKLEACFSGPANTAVRLCAKCQKSPSALTKSRKLSVVFTNVFIREERGSFQTIKIYENTLKKEDFNQIKIA